MTASVGKHVLIIVENLPVPFDRRVWQESNTLKAAGYDVTVVCPTGRGYDARRETIDGIDVYRYQLPMEGNGVLGYVVEYTWALAMQFWLAARVFFKKRFHVLHACNPPDNIFLVALPFKLFGVKFLFDHHDINPELYEAKFGRRDFFYKVMLFWERLTFWIADASIATNESYRNIAIQRGKMNPDRVTIVRSGPDLSRLKTVEPVAALKQGREYLVGYVGVMGQQEGIDLLLETVQYIVESKDRHDVHFALVGDGTELAELKRQAQEMRIADYVTFTGRVPDAELLEVLNTADVCVNPDRANEMNDKSTMNKIMEYMALGKPIVQFDLTEGRFSAREASLYADKNDPVDFGNKIIELLDDPDKRAEMGAYGKNRVVNELSWEYEVPKLLGAYEQLLNQKPSQHKT
ncbi:MAG: glycosyltransferase family 4 protein [Pseudomonadota bacterium]